MFSLYLGVYIDNMYVIIGVHERKLQNLFGSKINHADITQLIDFFNTI